MDMLLPFILVWWGSHWWPGVEAGAPKPGSGDPWILGIVGGLAAILVMRLTGASTDPMAAAIAAVASGAVGSRIVGGLLGLVRK